MVSFKGHLGLLVYILVNPAVWTEFGEVDVDGSKDFKDAQA
jgi:hypothetical protein